MPKREAGQDRSDKRQYHPPGGGVVALAPQLQHDGGSASGITGPVFLPCLPKA